MSPSKPKPFCAARPCQNRVDSGYCPDHQQGVQQGRTRFQKGNYGRPWRRIRQRFIDSDLMHLWCAECLKQGKKVVMDDVDHIIPHRGDKVLRDDFRNMQSLCKAHHSAKTAKEVGFGS